MKILIDIGHPAHVHYFRNFTKIIENKNHTILVVARDKEVSQILLKKYNISFETRGKGANGLIGKLIYLATLLATKFALTHNSTSVDISSLKVVENG